MQLSIGLFLNLFILTQIYNNLSYKYYLKTTILILFIELINISHVVTYIKEFEILLIDGMIKINKLIIYEEIIIFIIAIVILLFYKFNIKWAPGQNTSKIMIQLLNIISIKFLLESYELFIFFLNWELFNLSLYIYITSDNCSEKSLAVGFKYFLLSALNTSFLLLGLFILYYEIGGLQYDNILLYINVFPDNSPGGAHNINIAKYFILFTFLFKLSAVPFHNWSPDLYENVSMKITTWIMIIPKILVLFIIINFYSLLQDTSLFIITGIASLIIGSIGLTQQFQIRRFITYSAITNIGYLLLTMNNLTNLIINIIIYNFTILNILLILLKYNHLKTIQDLNGLYKFNPYIIFIFTFNLFSLAGIPPLAGFQGKILLIEEYLNHNSVVVLLTIIISSTIVIYNYLRPLFNLNFAHSGPQAINVAENHLNNIEATIISIFTLFIIGIILEPIEWLTLAVETL